MVGQNNISRTSTGSVDLTIDVFGEPQTTNFKLYLRLFYALMVYCLKYETFDTKSGGQVSMFVANISKTLTSNDRCFPSSVCVCQSKGPYCYVVTSGNIQATIHSVLCLVYRCLPSETLKTFEVFFITLQIQW